MDENLIPFKDNFYKECNTINFFLNLLKEIQTQVEFFGYICEKDFKILATRAENGLKNIDVIKTNLKKYKNEPSNLFLIESELLKFLYIYYSSFKNIYQDYLNSFKSNFAPINANIDSPNAIDREFREHFALKDDIQYDAGNEYYLIIKNLDTGFVERIPFVIDIAFQDGFDFF